MLRRRAWQLTTENRNNITGSKPWQLGRLPRLGAGKKSVGAWGVLETKGLLRAPSAHLGAVLYKDLG